VRIGLVFFAGSVATIAQFVGDQLATPDMIYFFVGTCVS
jgi:hypothetical protein